MVGAGFVGSTTALRILQRGLADVCLIDVVEGLPQGLALDMNQSAPIERFEVACTGTNDYRDTAGSHLAIITAGFPRGPGMSRMDLIETIWSCSETDETCAPSGPRASNGSRSWRCCWPSARRSPSSGARLRYCCSTT